MACFSAEDPYPDSILLNFLWKFYNGFFCEFVRGQNEHESYYAIPCILINLFHFYILTRKSMGSSPIYIIMAAIAVLDICSSFYSVHRQMVLNVKVFNICYSEGTDYAMLFIRVFLDCSRNLTRRSSTWLSFSITLIRLLVIKYPLNRKFDVLSKPKAAYYTIPTVILLCALINIIDPFRHAIFHVDEDTKCTQYTLHEYYWFGDAEFYTDNDYFVAKFHKIADGLISRILPCILFTIITYFLMRAIKEAEKQSRAMASSSNTKLSKNTSNLVLALTLSFFVAGMPMGIICVLSPFSASAKDPNEGFVMYVLLSTFEDFFSIVLTITTASHMVICILMSSAYRETTLTILRCGMLSNARNDGNSLTASN